MPARLTGFVALLALIPVAGAGCGPRDEREVEARPEPRAPGNIDLDPPLNPWRSPHTGWTRAHYEAVFGELLLGFVAVRSEAGGRTAHPEPGGDEMPAAMEGAVRTLPALGAWLACPCNPERIIVDGRRLDVAALARDIVVAGTDPTGPDYWGPIGRGWNQRAVEAAMVAEFLLRSKARVWDRLTPFEQAKIMAWLEPAEEPLASNWLAFQIARNTTRMRLGRDVPAAAMTEQLDRLEADYLGDGFYRDGYDRRVDWYNGLVIHGYLTLWRSELGASDPARAERLAARTRAFLGRLPYLIDAAGRVAPLGRSLAYRSAVLYALAASVIAEDGFVDPGLARRTMSASLRFHREAGLFTADHRLTRGYQGEQARVLEAYIRPGSQYYFSHALQVLALPPEHPFWTAAEQPLPADEGDFVHAIPSIGWMIDHDRAVDRRAPKAPAGAGLVLHNARSSTNKASYAGRYKKLSYAAGPWYAVAEGGGPRPYDSLVISAGEGRFSRRRSAAREWAVAPGFAWQRYAMIPEGLEPREAGQTELPEPHWISTAALTGMAGADDPQALRPTLRLSCVSPSFAAPARPYAGSVAIARPSPSTALGGGEALWRYVESEDLREPASPDRGSAGAGAVFLAGLHGWQRAGRRLDLPSTGAAGPAHALGGEASFVGLGLADDHPGLREPACFASLQQFSERPFNPGAVLAEAPVAEFDGEVARVAWPDGARAWVALGPETEARSVTLGPLRARGSLRLFEVTGEGESLAFVALGLRELADDRGPLLRSPAEQGASSIACRRERGGWICELDGPVELRAEAQRARLREPGWWGPTALAPAIEVELEPDAEGWLRLDPRAHGLGPEDRESSTVIVELRPRAHAAADPEG